MKALALIMFVSCAVATSAHGQIDCKPLRPATTNKATEDTAKAKANFLLKWIGAGEISNSYTNVEADVLRDYPQADKLLVWRTYIYVACTMIASSHLSDEQKWERWVQLSTLYPLQPPAPPQTAPASAPAAATTDAPRQDICHIEKRLAGPGRVTDANGGFNVDESVVQVRNCDAIFHWKASARLAGCEGVAPKDGPWLSITPTDDRDIGTQDPIVIGMVSVANASDFFAHDTNITARVTRASVEAATRIRVSMGGDSCSNRHVH